MTAVVTENLSLLAGAPGGIACLRRLILDLAISGKLVPQSHSDGSAAALIAQAAVLKASTGKGRKGRGNESSSGALSAEGLPSGWHSARLGELVTKLGAGSTPLGGKQVYTSDGVIFLRSQNVWNDGLRLDDVARIPEEIHDGMAGTHVVSGDLLFNITGASIGRCAAVPSQFPGGNVSQHVVIVRPAIPEMQAYLHKVLISDLVQDAVIAAQVGVSREGLSVAKLSDFKIPLPPLAEQHRIVAKVDELMALCDRLEARQQDAEAAHARLVQALLDSLTQARDAQEFQAGWERLAGEFETLFTTEESVDMLLRNCIQLALAGRFATHVSTDDPASSFVRQASFARNEALGARGRKISGSASPAASIDRTVPGMPENWCRCRVDEVTECLDYLRRPINKSDREGRTGSVPYYGANGQVGWIDEHIFDEKLVLVVEDETFIGRTKPFSYVVQGKSWVNNHAHVLRPLAGMSAEYLNLCLHRYDFIPLTSGTTGRRKLTQAGLNAAVITIAPLAEQERILAKAEEFTVLCDQLKARIAAGRAKQAQLAEALVKQAVAAAG